MLNRLEVDKAVFFAVCVRIWQLAAGVVTLLLMAHYFSRELQGYYFTFSALVALQTFFELGFNIVIVNICSHEWTKLRLDPDGSIAGNRAALSRLRSLGRLLFAWYGAASLLFTVIVSVGGAWFIGQKHDTPVDWFFPWLTLVLFSGGLLATVPFHALLEGCNQVVAVNVYRLLQAIAGNVTVWLFMSTGGDLWALAASSAVRFLADVLFITFWFGPFFRTFTRRPQSERVAWQTEVWPLQWRIGVLGLVSYFAFYLFTPVMFHYHGPEVAGQMGMTWTVVTAIQAAALAWVHTRAPRFGMLIRRGDFHELDRIFFRLTTLAGAAFVLAAGTFWAILYVMTREGFSIVNRLVSLEATGLLLIGALVQLVASCQAIYVRAHKREPFLVVGVVMAISIGLGVWLLGARYGPTGAAASYVAVQLLLTLPAHSWFVHIARREWRGSEFASAETPATPQGGFLAQFIQFLVQNPFWWLAPIIMAVVLIILAAVLIPSESLPFIYRLW